MEKLDTRAPKRKHARSGDGGRGGGHVGGRLLSTKKRRIRVPSRPASIEG